jgi:hypothetical protein
VAQATLQVRVLPRQPNLMEELKMRWPWQKKSAFDCGFYDKPGEINKEEVSNSIISFLEKFFDLKSEKETLKIKDLKPIIKKTEKSKEEKKVWLKKLIKRGQGGVLDERLTNKQFGIYIDYNESEDKSLLPYEAMMVAILMDIRERLDTLIELQHKTAAGKKEKKTKLIGKNKGE